MDPISLRLATAEFLAVDVETNGRAGDLCELTEVGAVLVGGGELHDRFESLARVEQPLSRGIERFTGITQAMVDSAPEAGSVLKELAAMIDGRVLVAHNAGFDDRVLRQAFDRACMDWPDPPVLCTVSMARRFAPLIQRRGLEPLADALGIEVEGTHRALVDAETCARVFCALFPKLCAAVGSVAEAVALLGPGAGGRRWRRGRGGVNGPAPRRRPPEDRPDLSALPRDPGVYIFRDERGRPLYVGKSVSLRTRARAHFCQPAGWTGRAEVVDYRPTNSELGALVLENRLIKAWQPPGNVKLKRADGFVYLRTRLDIEYPVLEVAAEPAPGRAVNVGPLRGKASAQELVDQLNSLFGLRHCGRALPRREHASIYGQMGRCLSPCLRDLDPNLYRSRLDAALGLFDGPDDAGRVALLGHLERTMWEAAAAQHYERAAALRTRHERLSALLAGLGGMLQAVHARSRLAVARHPVKSRYDAFVIVAGRVVEWGPLRGAGNLARGVRAALEGSAGSAPISLAPEEVDEVRIVSSWLAGNDVAGLTLEEAADSVHLRDLLAHL